MALCSSATELGDASQEFISVLDFNLFPCPLVNASGSFLDCRWGSAGRDV